LPHADGSHLAGKKYAHGIFPEMGNQVSEAVCGRVAKTADTEIFLFGISGKPHLRGVPIRPVDYVLPQAISNLAQYQQQQNGTYHATILFQASQKIYPVLWVYLYNCLWQL
jgi:hypothetical protein